MTEVYNDNDLWDYLIETISEDLGIFEKEKFREELKPNSISDFETRFAFKYGCLRGVHETPYFIINGIPFEEGYSFK